MYVYDLRRTRFYQTEGRDPRQLVVYEALSQDTKGTVDYAVDARKLASSRVASLLSRKNFCCCMFETMYLISYNEL